MTRLSFSELGRQVGRTIRSRREAKGLSQEDVAHEADLSVRHYYQIETGVANPTLKSLYQIAKALDVSVRDLLGEAERSRVGARR